MTTPDQALERLKAFFLKLETTQDTIIDHVASDGVRHAGAGFSPTREREVVEDSGTGVALGAFTVHGKKAEWAYPENHIRIPTTLGGISESQALLEALVGSVTANLGSTTVDDVAATTTVIDLAAGAGALLKVGDLIYFVTLKECGLIDAISTDEITLKIPLSAAPANGEAVRLGLQYRPTDALRTLSGFEQEDHSILALVGLNANEGSIAIGRSQTSKLDVSGLGSGKRAYGGSVTLKTVILIGQAMPFVVTLDTDQHQAWSVEDGTLFAQINDEVFTVTAVDRTAGTLTLGARAQKGSAAEAHAIDDEIQPWFATATQSGTEINGLVGGISVLIGGSLRTIPIRSAKLTINNGAVRDNQAFNGFDNRLYRQGQTPRTVTYEIVARFTKEEQRLLGQAEQEIDSALAVWAGDDASRVLAIGSRKVRFDFPTKSSGGGGETVLTFSGMAQDSALLDADEYRIATL